MLKMPDGARNGISADKASEGDEGDGDELDGFVNDITRKQRKPLNLNLTDLLKAGTMLEKNGSTGVGSPMLRLSSSPRDSDYVILVLNQKQREDEEVNMLIDRLRGNGVNCLFMKNGTSANNTLAKSPIPCTPDILEFNTNPTIPYSPEVSTQTQSQPTLTLPKEESQTKQVQNGKKRSYRCNGVRTKGQRGRKCSLKPPSVSVSDKDIGSESSSCSTSVNLHPADASEEVKVQSESESVSDPGKHSTFILRIPKSNKPLESSTSTEEVDETGYSSAAQGSSCISNSQDVGESEDVDGKVEKKKKRRRRRKYPYLVRKPLKKKIELNIPTLNLTKSNKPLSPPKPSVHGVNVKVEDKESVKAQVKVTPISSILSPSKSNLKSQSSELSPHQSLSHDSSPSNHSKDPYVFIPDDGEFDPPPLKLFSPKASRKNGLCSPSSHSEETNETNEVKVITFPISPTLPHISVSPTTAPTMSSVSVNSHPPTPSVSDPLTTPQNNSENINNPTSSQENEEDQPVKQKVKRKRKNEISQLLTWAIAPRPTTPRTTAVTVSSTLFFPSPVRETVEENRPISSTKDSSVIASSVPEDKPEEPTMCKSSIETLPKNPDPKLEILEMQANAAIPETPLEEATMVVPKEETPSPANDPTPLMPSLPSSTKGNPKKKPRRKRKKRSELHTKPKKTKVQITNKLQCVQSISSNAEGEKVKLDIDISDYDDDDDDKDESDNIAVAEIIKMLSEEECESVDKNSSSSLQKLVLDSDPTLEPPVSKCSSKEKEDAQNEVLVDSVSDIPSVQKKVVETETEKVSTVKDQDTDSKPNVGNGTILQESKEPKALELASKLPPEPSSNGVKTDAEPTSSEGLKDNGIFAIPQVPGSSGKQRSEATTSVTPVANGNGVVGDTFLDAMQLRRPSFYSLIAGNVRNNMENFLDGRVEKSEAESGAKSKRRKRPRPRNGFLLHHGDLQFRHGDNFPEDPEAPYKLHLATQIILKLNKRRGKFKPKEDKGKSLLSYLKLVPKRASRTLKNFTPLQEEKTGKDKEEVPENEEGQVNTVFTGEWVQERNFVCNICGQVEKCFWDMVHHKGEIHPGIVVTHVELVDMPPEGFRGPPPIPSTSGVPPPPPCTKCSATFSNYPDLHRHIFECAGNTGWLNELKEEEPQPQRKKKSKRKRGFNTFKRRLSNTPKKCNTKVKIESSPLKRRSSGFKCEFCTREFKTEGWLKNHLTTHSLPIRIPLDKLKQTLPPRASGNVGVGRRSVVQNLLANGSFKM